VEAETEVFAMRLGSAAFKKVLESEPKVSLAMLQTLAERLRATDSAAAVQ
jgi:CRP-like cAMP-binding protein